MLSIVLSIIKNEYIIFFFFFSRKSISLLFWTFTSALKANTLYSSKACFGVSHICFENVMGGV